MISFVVQGPIHDRLDESLHSIRWYYPEAEIVLSTYKGSRLPHKSLFDILVESTDPGPIDHPIHQANISLNRQIITTSAGLRAATRPFACKIRNDLKVTNTTLSENIVKQFEYPSEYKVFQSKIWTSDIYSINPFGQLKFPYHPGDWIYFGYLEDLKTLFDIPLYTTEQVATPEGYLCKRNEQYIFLKCLQKFEKYKDLDIEYDCDPSADKYLAMKLLTHNFAIASLKDLGFESMKYGPIINQYNTYIDSQNYFIFEDIFAKCIENMI